MPIPLTLTGVMPGTFGAASSLAGAQQPQAVPSAPATAPQASPPPATTAPPPVTQSPAAMSAMTQGGPNPLMTAPALNGGANAANLNNPNSGVNSFIMALLSQLMHGGSAFGALGASAPQAPSQQVPGMAGGATALPGAMQAGGGGAGVFGGPAPAGLNPLGALPPPSAFANDPNLAAATAAAGAPIQSAQQQNQASQALAQQAAQVQQQIMFEQQTEQAALNMRNGVITYDTTGNGPTPAGGFGSA